MNAFGNILLLVLVLGFVGLIIAIGGNSGRSRAKRNQAAHPGGAEGVAPLAGPEPHPSSSSGCAWLLAWGAACALVSLIVLSDFGHGGCDGGLCILELFVLPPAWLVVGLVVWLIKLLNRNTTRK